MSFRRDHALRTNIGTSTAEGMLWDKFSRIHVQ